MLHPDDKASCTDCVCLGVSLWNCSASPSLSCTFIPLTSIEAQSGHRRYPQRGCSAGCRRDSCRHQEQVSPHITTPPYYTKASPSSMCSLLEPLFLNLTLSVHHCQCIAHEQLQQAKPLTSNAIHMVDVQLSRCTSPPFINREQQAHSADTSSMCKSKWGGRKSHKVSRVVILANTPSPSPTIPLFEKYKSGPQSTRPAPWSDRTRKFDAFRPKVTLPQLKMTVKKVADEE